MAELPACENDGAVMTVGGAGKCLGYWSCGDLTTSRCVEENIKISSSTLRVLEHFKETSAPSPPDLF